MTKHTPGPWNVEEYGNGAAVVVGEAKAHEVIANRLTVEDANLIAAAPDMLTACEAAVEHMRRPLNIDEAIRVGAILRAAIAKARGQG